MTIASNKSAAERLAAAEAANTVSAEEELRVLEKVEKLLKVA